MTEFWFFLIAGVIAVAAAIMMLLSENAVHSALFLVITMVAIAFLFLLLDAPFLAMIQITVYAGAIMVLFLFVIMLLGSEQVETKAPGEAGKRFRWFLPAAFTLSLTLLVAIGLTIVQSSQSQSNLNNVPPSDAQFRIINAAANAGTLSVQIENVKVFDSVDFHDGTGFFKVHPGVYTINLIPTNGDPVPAEVTIEPGSAGTLIAYSDETGLRYGFVADDLSTVKEDRSGRVIVFNAYPDAAAISLVDTGSEFVKDDTTTIVGDLGLGVASAPKAVEEGTVNWQFVQADNVNQSIKPLAAFSVTRNTSELVILTKELFADGSPTGAERPSVITTSTPARASFGGPQAIGFLLFSDYLLPFQLLALLLLAAMVGAIVLTHRELQRPVARIGVRRRVSRSLVNVIAAQVGHDVTDESEANRLPADEPETVGN